MYKPKKSFIHEGTIFFFFFFAKCLVFIYLRTLTCIYIHNYIFRDYPLQKIEKIWMIWFANKNILVYNILM